MCVIDWTLLRDLLGSASAIIIAFVALWGFNHWRDELIGKSKLETVRKIALLAFRFHREFREACPPVFIPTDSVARPRDTIEPPKLEKVRDQYTWRLRRLEPAIKTRLELDEAAWEADKIWHLGITNYTMVLTNPLTELQGIINQYFTYESFQCSDPSFLEGMNDDRKIEHGIQLPIILGIDPRLLKSVESALTILTDQLGKHTK